MFLRLKGKLHLAIMACAAVLLTSGVAYAANTPDFSQTINAGTLTTDILDSGRNAVGSPSVTMSAQNFSFDCQTSTGTFGSSSERIYVSNPDAADSGWTLTVAATSGNTDTWSDGSNTIDFNDPTGSTAGCSDGADTDSVAGQMTVDPSAGTLTTDCGSCTSTSITKGSSSSFDEGSTDSITLLNAASGSDDIWRGYLTGATVSQTIPAETPASTYTVNLTLTATSQ